MQMAQRSMIFVSALLIGSSCASSVTFRPESRLFKGGDQATVHFRNGSLYTVWGNLCLVALERRCGETWNSAANRELGERVCLAILDKYPSGFETDVTVRLDPDTPAGVYRVVSRIEVNHEERRLASEPIVVAEAAGGARRGSCEDAAKSPVASDRAAPGR